MSFKISWIMCTPIMGGHSYDGYLDTERYDNKEEAEITASCKYHYNHTPIISEDK